MSHLDAAAPELPNHSTYLQTPYFPALDGLRALCVLLVINLHMAEGPLYWHWLAGWRGVTVFFVLSGYLITTLALREEARRGRVHLTAFYVRRSLRIFPLYYLTLAAYCLLILGLGAKRDVGPALGEALPAYLLYLQEVPTFAAKEAGLKVPPFSHSWSLGIEEKFYLVWPLLAFVLWRARAGRRRAGTVGLLAALAVLPPVLGLFGWGLAARWLGCFFPITVGCLLAELLHDPRWYARLQWLNRHLLLVLLVLLVCHFATPWLGPPHEADALVAPYSLAAAALLACLLTGGGRLRRALSWGPLVAVGRLSYGMYLIHYICMYGFYAVAPSAWGHLDRAVIYFVIVSALTVAAAWLLAEAVERPCVELGRRWSRWLTERAAPAESPLSAAAGSL
jgi:peptidoglycan/LPS O-acetylase OafA/YrhL